jgi:hypothetical protein
MNFDKREIGRHPHVGISAPICANFKQLIIQLLGLIAHYAVVRLGGGPKGGTSPLAVDIYTDFNLLG